VDTICVFYLYIRLSGYVHVVISQPSPLWLIYPHPGSFSNRCMTSSHSCRLYQLKCEHMICLALSSRIYLMAGGGVGVYSI